MPIYGKRRKQNISRKTVHKNDTRKNILQTLGTSEEGQIKISMRIYYLFIVNFAHKLISFLIYLLNVGTFIHLINLKSCFIN